MNETSKTVAFIITAGILGVAAGWSHWMTKPKPVTGFEKVGEEFFPEFLDGTEATSLMVSAFDPDSETVREFSVMKKDGRWRIPSHHDYPAEAAERLARTATSLIGVERDSIVERRANKHADYQVVDPTDDEADAESAGQRITLRNETGDIIADYIIGKPAGNAANNDQKMVRDIDSESDYFYVRVPSEKETYKAKLKIDLSTRFSDWINPDLLKLEAADINRLEIDNYELTEQDVQVGNRVMSQMNKRVIDQQLLTRDGFDPWKLDGLNEETEEIDTLKVESIATLLDSMKIVGVRPKQKMDGELLVKSDLTVNEELARKDPRKFQSAVAALQRDLDRKGFTIGQTTEEGSGVQLMASRGELRAATKEGVRYTLYFGRSVSGDLDEIEIGAAATEDSATSDENNSDESVGEEESRDASVEGQESDAESGAEDESADETAENKSRYVAIRVDFDPTALGDQPVTPTEPTAPEKPEGFDEWKQAKEKRLEEASNDAMPEDEANEDKSADPDNDVDKNEADMSEQESEDEEAGNQEDEAPAPPKDIAAANDEKFEAYESALAEFEKAEIQYTTDLELHETQTQEYQGREKAGKELVEELNDRFAEWFYVVPAESLAKLKLTRADIVKLRESSPPNASPQSGAGMIPPMGLDANRLPDAPNIDLPNDDKPAQDPEENPADDKKNAPSELTDQPEESVKEESKKESPKKRSDEDNKEGNRN